MWEMESQRKVSAMAAAAEAGAKYVWATCYADGIEAGWAAGWEAGWTATETARSKDEQTNKKTARKDASKQGGSANEVNAERDSGKTTLATLKMSDEWAALFARGEAKRKRQRTDLADNDSEAEEVKAQDIDLGGKSQKRKHERTKALYGDAAQELLQLEAQLDGQFQTIVSKTGAHMWPVV